MRILGIDYGTKRIGVAIGDTEAKVAVPLVVVKNEKLKVKNVIDDIFKVVRSENVELIVIGQGGKGPVEKLVQEFAEELRKFVRVEIADEHFTTAQIEKIMQSYGKDRRKIDKDSAAAALILQSWLDSYDL